MAMCWTDRLRCGIALALLTGLGACVEEAGNDGRSPGWSAAVQRNIAAQRAATGPDAATRARMEAEFQALGPASVSFSEGSAIPDARSSATLDRQAAWLRAHPGFGVILTGHTDPTGSAESNRTLGLRRAETVRTALLARGVAPRQIARIASAGESGPGGRPLGRLVVANLTTDPTRNAPELDGQIAERVYDLYKSGTQTVTEAESTETN